MVAGWVISAQNGPAMSPLATESVHQALSASSPVIGAPRLTAPRNFLSSHFCVSRASGFASDTASAGRVEGRVELDVERAGAGTAPVHGANNWMSRTWADARDHVLRVCDAA